MSIRKLPDDVVNKIAAGEILVRPMNAVKELVENSIDAGAKNITIVINGGGLTSIQIIDDGCGIPTNDHALLCERFATSKLKSFDDLNSGVVSSFGFRGEALASVSLVGHVSVYTKSIKSSEGHGYESRYSAGKLLPGYPSPVPFNGSSGTRIIVEDLFFNNPVKKSSFKSSSNEYRLILDLVSRLAISFPDMNFSLKKSHETYFDIQTQTNDSRPDRITSLFGIDSNFLLHSDSTILSPPPYPLESVEYIISKPEASVSKTLSTILINNRLVELSSFTKQFQCEFSDPYFLFLKLVIKPDAIDVNVSPTKKSVVILNESEIIAFVTNQIMDKVIQSRKVKIIKLKPISFTQDKTTSKSSVSSNFKIHTCPRQNFFTTVFGVSENPVPMSQVSLAFTQQEPFETVPTPQKRNSDNSITCHPIVEKLQEKYVCDFTRFSSGKNPKDSIVRIGEINNRFIICQYFSHLCICDVLFLGEFLIKWYLISNWLDLLDGISEDDHCSELPLWISNLVGMKNNELVFERFPSIVSSNCEISGDEAVAVLHDLRQVVGGGDFSELSVDSLDGLLTFLSRKCIERDLENSSERIWNTVVKNGRFYPPIPVGSEKHLQDVPLFVATEKSQFFFRQLISLKELYKEFERC